MWYIKLWAIEIVADGAKVVCHIPFKVPVVGCQVQVVGEVHASRCRIAIELHCKVAIDLPMIGRDYLPMLVSDRANTKSMTCVLVRAIVILHRLGQTTPDPKILLIAVFWSRTHLQNCIWWWFYLDDAITFTDKCD